MNFFVKMLTITGALLVTSSLHAVIPEKYQTILDRNPFGLLPPPPPPPEPTTTPPPSDLKFTGIATIGGERRVYFTIPPKTPKDTQQYINLAEGQREGTLEIVSISEAEGEVRITNGGIDQVLSLKKDGFKPAQLGPGVMPAPMPTPLSAAPQASPVYNPNPPTGVVQPQPQPQPQPGLPPPSGQPQVNPAVQTSPGTPEMRTIPTRTLRTPPLRQ